MPDGNSKQLFEFGPEGPGVVRLAFTGRGYYRHLAAATDAVVVGQGPSPDPPAANRAEESDFGGRSLIGRPVLKWLSEVPARFGGWVFAARPPDPDLSDSGGCLPSNTKMTTARSSSWRSSRQSSCLQTHRITYT